MPTVTARVKIKYSKKNLRNSIAIFKSNETTDSGRFLFLRQYMHCWKTIKKKNMYREEIYQQEKKENFLFVLSKEIIKNWVRGVDTCSS